MSLLWRHPTLYLVLAAAAALSVASCDNDDDDPGSNGGDRSRGTASIEPIEANIKTSVPLAYAASVAMAAVNGRSIPNAAASGTCSFYPCLATVAVTLSAGDLPVALDEYGEVFVAGLWSDSDTAVLTTSFNNMHIGSENNVVLKISTFPVTVGDDDVVTAVYGSVDIDIDSEPDDTVVLSPDEVAEELQRVDTPVTDDPDVNVNMDAWVLRVDTQNTDDFADDHYTVSGGGQYIGVNSTRTSVIQLGLVDMRVSPDCALNPVAGAAVLNELDVDSGPAADYPKIGVATFTFHSGCDGTARIAAAAGTYGIYIDDEIALNL